MTSLKENGSGIEGIRAVRIPVATILIGCVLVSLAATRLGMETADTDTYLRVYDDYAAADGLLNAPFGPLFMLIGWIGKNLGATDSGYLWLVAIAGVSAKLVGIRRCSQFFWLSVAVYISKYFALHEMAQVRAGIAAGIFLFSIPLLQRRAMFKYTLCILIASAFHQSALAYLLLYPIGKITYRKFTPLATLAAGGLIFSILNVNGALLSLASTHFPKINTYLDLLSAGEYSEIHIFNTEIVLKILIWSVLAANYNKLSRNYKYFDLLFRIWTLSLILYFSMISVPVFAFRVSELLDISTIILFPALIIAFPGKIIGSLCFFTVVMAFFVNYYFLQPIFL
ncbi:EpsG family protein [Ralstonia pickettii]|uniref:EpsG family protein n=1 Tax=Ralstonia pickettii TaxID=329 RepID=UPI0015C0E4B4|nr:EpsG family protein [Ralstonia pickettii]NWK43821.1 EpsG family protein [Ralstonia pickettii]